MEHCKSPDILELSFLPYKVLLTTRNKNSTINKHHNDMKRNVIRTSQLVTTVPDQHRKIALNKPSLSFRTVIICRQFMEKAQRKT